MKEQAKHLEDIAPCLIYMFSLVFFPTGFFKIYAWNIFLMAIGFFTFFSKPLRQIWCRPFSTYIGCTINHDGPSHILFDISLHPLAVSLRENSKSKLLIEVKQFLFLWSFLLNYINNTRGYYFLRQFFFAYLIGDDFMCCCCCWCWCCWGWCCCCCCCNDNKLFEAAAAAIADAVAAGLPLYGAVAVGVVVVVGLGLNRIYLPLWCKWGWLLLWAGGWKEKMKKNFIYTVLCIHS